MSPVNWLPHPPDVGVPLVVQRDALGPVTYEALLREGVLRPLWGNTARWSSTPERPDHRAAALGVLVPPRAVIGRRSAVWVHTGQAPVQRVDVLVAPRNRRPDPHPLRVTHECELPAGEVVVLGGVRVTSVQRTGLDIARWSPGAESFTLLSTLIDAGFDVSAALDQLDRLKGYANVRRAAQRLRAMSEQQSQTRIAGSSDALAPVMR